MELFASVDEAPAAMTITGVGFSVLDVLCRDKGAKHDLPGLLRQVECESGTKRLDVLRGF